MYNSWVDVAISELRADLRAWVDRARSGENVVVTERGLPVARLVAVDSSPLIDRLEKEGVLSRPTQVPRVRAADVRRVEAEGSVSDLVSELRRDR